MASGRDDFIIAIRSAFLKKSNKQQFSLLALIMIYSGHSAENKIFKIAKLNESINELKNEFIDKRSQLIQLKMESKISLKLTHIDLEPANKPPIKIVYEN